MSTVFVCVVRVYACLPACLCTGRQAPPPQWQGCYTRAQWVPQGLGGLQCSATGVQLWCTTRPACGCGCGCRAGGRAAQSPHAAALPGPPIPPCAWLAGCGCRCVLQAVMQGTRPVFTAPVPEQYRWDGGGPLRIACSPAYVLPTYACMHACTGCSVNCPACQACPRWLTTAHACMQYGGANAAERGCGASSRGRGGGGRGPTQASPAPHIQPLAGPAAPHTTTNVVHRTAPRTQ